MNSVCNRYLVTCLQQGWHVTSPSM